MKEPPRNEAEAEERVVAMLVKNGLDADRARDLWLERPFDLDMHGDGEVRGAQRPYTEKLWTENRGYFRRILRETRAAEVSGSTLRSRQR